MKRTFLYLAGLTVLTVLAMGQSPFQSAPPKVEAALRARVGQLYASPLGLVCRVASTMALILSMS